MDFLNRSWVTIRAQLEGLSASQKWLIATLLVLGTLVVGILLTVAGQPETVAINQFTGNRSDEAMARLRAAGIDAEKEGNQIRVPVEQRDDAILMLVEGDLLSDDAAAAFDTLIASQSPWSTNSQNDQAYLIAKQKVIAGILRKMKGVRSADVVIDMPRNPGFGKAYIKPSASVTITTNGRVDAKQMVEAVSGLVSGAVAEMSASDVRVIIDGQMNHVNKPGEAAPGELIDLVRSQEEHHYHKINSLLSYIPGVRVAVHVQIDQVTTKAQETFEYEKAEPLQREMTEETSRRNIAGGGEPGVLPNTGLTIDSGNARGTEETTSKTESEFGPKNLVLREQTQLAGHMTKLINVTINVPRNYFVQIWKGANANAQSEPDDAALTPIVTAQLAAIEKMVGPLIRTSESQGEVVTVMIPDDSMFVAKVAETAGAGFTGVLVESDWAKPVGVGLLALVSVALMFGMVRKAAQQESLPSVEELAGVPPRLPTEDELVGEADEMEASMAGVELDENELRARKIAQQIGDLVKANPDEAGTLLGRWVRRDE